MTDIARRCYTTRKFTDRELRLICDSLRERAIPRRWEILPDFLQDWAAHELTSYFEEESPEDRNKQRRDGFKAIETSSLKLLKAIETLDEEGRVAFVVELGRMQGHKHSLLALAGVADECYESTHRIVSNVAIAASGAKKSRRGRPVQRTQHLVIDDIAGIFEWQTGTAGGRSVDRDTSEETGPLRRFAEAMWPAVFHAGDDGLTTAMKKLPRRRRHKDAAQQDQPQAGSLLGLPAAKPSLLSEAWSEGDENAAAERLYGPVSAGARPFDAPSVIRCVALRHPEWQIFLR